MRANNMIALQYYLLGLLLVVVHHQGGGRVGVVDACTVFLVGKDASADGSVMVSHSNDGEFKTDPRLVKIPSRSHSDTHSNSRPVFFSPERYPRYVGTARGDIPEYRAKVVNANANSHKMKNQTDFEPIGFIPDGNTTTSTFTYLEQTYGAVNEHQVGIGESTCSGVFGAIPLGAPNGTALLSIDALSQIAMERATSARDAIQIMGQLAEEYGFYGAGEFEGTAESLGVTDADEAWIFHILPDPTGRSAIWAARRIPDDSFAVLANMFVIRDLDPTDTDNYLMSKSVHDVAIEYGWWTANNETAHGVLLDFTKIYSDGEYAHKYYSGRRMWGGYHLACPSQNYSAEYTDLQSDPVYPLFCKPDQKISAQDLFRYHRYTYQDTPFDLGAPGNLAGGPFGSPDRWKSGPVSAHGDHDDDVVVSGNWERPIGLYRASDTYVVQSNQEWTLGAVLWFGPASALATIFTPFLVNLADIPASFRSGHQAEFSRTSAFWAACVAHNVANLKWNYAIREITQRQLKLESASMQMVLAQEEQYRENSHNSSNMTTSMAMATVQQAYFNNIDIIVASLWSLSDEILFKYASGFVNELPDADGEDGGNTGGGMSQMVGYPAWWLQAVGYEQGPPPPPTKPKCCQPPRNTAMKRFLKHGSQ
jgi:dipeptidase